MGQRLRHRITDGLKTHSLQRHTAPKQATNECHQKHVGQWRRRQPEGATCDASPSGEGLCQSDIFGHGHFLGTALYIEFAGKVAGLQPATQRVAQQFAPLAKSHLH